MIKKLVSSLLAFAMCFSLSIPAFATEGNNGYNDVHMLKDIPPASDSIIPFGAKPPGASNGTHNLSSSSYSYDVASVGAQVYTDRWLTGAKTIECTVGGYEHLDGSAVLVYETVTFTVYNSKNQVVAKNSVNVGKGGYYCTISGIPSSEKVYVKISVTHDNVLKTFYGSIRKVA